MNFLKFIQFGLNPSESTSLFIKMSTTKELSIDIRQKSIDNHKVGKGYRKISREINLPLSRVETLLEC